MKAKYGARGERPAKYQNAYQLSKFQTVMHPIGEKYTPSIMAKNVENVPWYIHQANVPTKNNNSSINAMRES